jgi:signal transduction histidine kinase
VGDADAGVLDDELRHGPGRLDEMAGHLVYNALRFTPRGGKATVRVAAAGPMAQLIVEDTGVGIPHEELGRIFEPFVQLEAARHQTEAGLGLGLFFARAAAEAHGGTLTAQSAGPGQGARFIAEMPGGAAPAGLSTPALVLPKEGAS